MTCNNSFSEDLIPRNAPSPTTTSPAEFLLVPEVSIIQNATTKIYSDYPEPKKTFNSWKLNNQNPTFNKSQPIKKHVRFIDVAPQKSSEENFNPVFSDSPILCRDLELSVFEPPVKIIQPIEPLRYSQIKKYQPVPVQQVPVITKIEPPVKEQTLEIVERREYEPTVRDLFDLIQKQNSQLVSLQKQVENLLSMKDSSDQTKAIEEAPPPPKPIIPVVPEPQIFHQTQIQQQQKMSIGVMTSFEFTIGSRNIETQTSVFNQIGDDLEESEDENDENENPVQMGWTLYKNAMEHVENILQKSSPTQDNSKKNKENWMRMKSIEHLRHLDMNFGDCNISASQRFTFGQSAPVSNERSFAMNNLAMKYLPGERLNEIVNKNQKVLPSSTDLSISTYKYMEKYGLLEENRTLNKKSNILDKKTIKNMPKLF